jgi:hypothetical protein
VVKDICKRIHNKFLNPLLVEKSIKNLVELDHYSNWVSFKSPGADTLVISLSREDKPITVSITESKDMDFEIRGEPDVLNLFIKELTAEVASIAATELCTCLVSEEQKESLKSSFRSNLLQAINDSFPFDD